MTVIYAGTWSASQLDPNPCGRSRAPRSANAQCLRSRNAAGAPRVLMDEEDSRALALLRLSKATFHIRKENAARTAAALEEFRSTHLWTAIRKLKVRS